MKLLFFTSYYPPFLANFYRSFPEYAQLSFAALQSKILALYFADTGAAYHFSKQAGAEVFLIIANCEPLQKKWAQENNITYSESNWAETIALEQIKMFAPDVLFMESIFDYYGTFLAKAKVYCKQIVAWISTPFHANLKLNDIDLILSSTPDFVDDFRKQGIASEYLLPAFDTRILKELAPQKKNITFSFVGGWSEVHIERKKALEFLVRNTAIQLWGYGFQSKKYSKRSFSYYRNKFLPIQDLLMDKYNGEVWGLEMYAILQRSVLTFNIHEALLNGRVGNMRMFEATGVGTLLLNDEGANLSELFIPGKEIETYKNLEEAAEKVKYYAEHPAKAIEMGKNAQARTLKDYTYPKYIEQLFHYFKKHRG
jgi:spore maturation protein CgeB